MTTDFFARIEAEFLPRIADAIGQHDRREQLYILPAGAPELPPRQRLTGDGVQDLRRHPHELDVTLEWDGLEVQRLFAAGGKARFAGYLASAAVQAACLAGAERHRFPFAIAADPQILIGGLDFEH